MTTGGGGLVAGLPWSVAQMQAYVPLELGVLWIVAQFDPLFTAPQIFGPLVLGGATVLAGGRVPAGGRGLRWDGRRCAVPGGQQYSDQEADVQA